MGAGCARSLAGAERDSDHLPQREPEAGRIGGAGAGSVVVPCMASVDEQTRIKRIASSIRVIPDFPKPGVMFQDITTLLLDPKAFRDTVELFVERYRDMRISVVAGVEARGFIFGPPIALSIGAKFVPLRKPKKLPVVKLDSQSWLEESSKKLLELLAIGGGH
ncbi:Adenine phosphoribosyltransferase 1 [Dendrobium catenatum]|uniref:adenine phosphoribosyltransferase n=1 Tax=Dendrobium catenatum TaxID=906689 RepID=A0A2I0WVM8_9ASPA|nr:Adenine phosphoribosyltransferase 1 [Dendrobium catenatum]